ncbi:MAG: hypothetical protein H6604_03935 [Flavobacteriales bacterium]|nr:hypothetical protein [Flavobacteriales bacterium]
MALYLHLSNLIFNKSTIDVENVKERLQFGISKLDQEDKYLLSFARMNPTEFDLDLLTDLGLTQKDFVITSRYGGKLFDANWLNIYSDYCWHELQNEKIEPKIKELEHISVDEFLAKYETPAKFLIELNR